ncbi:MAG: hypothetical protein RTV31_04470 [Candidatus Thorarchaeota archaeon]
MAIAKITNVEMAFGLEKVSIQEMNIGDTYPGMRNINISSRTIRRIAISIRVAAILLGYLATYLSGSVLYTVPLRCIMETTTNAMIPNKIAKPINQASVSIANNHNYPKSTTEIERMIR